MDRTVTIRVFQIVNAVDGFFFDFLDTVKGPSGTNVHAQPHFAGRQVIGAGCQGEIVGVVDQIQGKRIGRGGVTYQLFPNL